LTRTLRTSRFFPEADDNAAIRGTYETENVQANELLYRRADIADVVDSHLLALERAAHIGFGRYIISATTQFSRTDLTDLRHRAQDVVKRLFPDCVDLYSSRGWKLFPEIDRVYDNARAREDIGWRPKYDFRFVLSCLRAGSNFRSALASAVGAKGYHATGFADGPYPVA